MRIIVSSDVKTALTTGYEGHERELRVEGMLAMKDDWQGNRGNPVIHQGDTHDTHGNFYEHAGRHDFPGGLGRSNGPDHSPAIRMTGSDRPEGHIAFMWPLNAYPPSFNRLCSWFFCQYQYQPEWLVSQLSRSLG